MSRIARGTLVATLFLFTGIGCWPKDSTPAEPAADGDATLNYWNAIGRTHQKLADVGELVDDAQTPKRMATAMKDAAVSLRDLGREINRLPVKAVDGDAVNYAAQTGELMQDAGSLFADFGEFLGEVNGFVDESKSFGAGAEAFVRGFLGDPLGPFNDANQKMKQFDARRRALLDRFSALDTKGNKLDSLELTTRATLGKRYGKEFPTLRGGSDAPRATYQIIIVSLTVANKKADGKGWDAFPFAAPDLVVKLKNRNRGSDAETEKKSDTFTATYNSAGPLVSASDTLDIEVLDKDLKYDDEIGKTSRQVTAKELAAGKLTLTFGQVVSLELKFVKK